MREINGNGKMGLRAPMAGGILAAREQGHRSRSSPLGGQGVPVTEPPGVRSVPETGVLDVTPRRRGVWFVQVLDAPPDAAGHRAGSRARPFQTSSHLGQRSAQDQLDRVPALNNYGLELSSSVPSRFWISALCRMGKCQGQNRATPAAAAQPCVRTERNR